MTRSSARLAAALAFLLALPSCGSEAPDDLASAATPAAGAVPLYDDLGTHHVRVETRVPAAQSYFDQGMRLYYAFNHAEAIRAFDEAARLDPDCAMCYWGTALALGPNINAPAVDSASAARAFATVQEAVARAASASAREQALIRALATRYSADPLAPRAPLDSAYARAMEEVARANPEDAEVSVLYAESVMDLSPWQYWTKEGEPRPRTPEVLSTLERVIAANENHPGACHFYIHAVEAVHPERALPCAERLAALMPGAGHIVHMPGHIYVRVGRYLDAIRANEHAVHADESYIQDQRPGVGAYTLGYYPHNYDFLAFAAMMAGRRAQAMEAANKVPENIPDEMLRAPGLGFLQHRMTRPLQLQVRFGLWDDILRSPAPAADLPHARAMWSYARGRALAARGQLAEAEKELALVRGAARKPEAASFGMEFNPSGPVLALAAEVLAGRIAAARGEHDGAIAHLRAAAGMEDALVYGEPPDWTMPVRHDLGEVLLAAGRAAEAEAAYRDDLARFPRNGWALHGLARSLRAQGKAAAAARAEAELRSAWEGADVQPPQVD